MAHLANGTELLRWSEPNSTVPHLLLVTECLHYSAPAASAATDEETADMRAPVGPPVTGLPAPGASFLARFTDIAGTGETAGWPGLRRNSGR